MKKTIAFVFILSALIILSIGAFSSIALEYNNPDPLVLVKGTTLVDADKIKVSGDYGTITSAKSSDTQVFYVGRANKEGVEIFTNQPGQATLTITSYTTDTSGTVYYHTVTMQIKVVSEAEQTSALGKSADIVVEFGEKIQIPGHEGFYQITRYASTDSNIAFGDRIVAGDIEYPAILAKQKKGDCVVTFFYRVAGQSGEKEYKVNVTVIGPGDVASKPLTRTLQTTDSTAGTSASAPTSLVPDASSSSSSSSTSTQNDKAISTSVPAGEVTTMSGSFYKIANVKTNNATVASAKATGAEGSMGVEISGVAKGTATITFDTYESATASAVSRTVSVTVTASEKTSESTKTSVGGNPSDKGIYLGTRSYTTTVGTKMYAGVRIDGVKIDRKKDFSSWNSLRWVSSDTKVISVNSQTGLIKAVGAGKANLICVDKDGKSYDMMTLTVK